MHKRSLCAGTGRPVWSWTHKRSLLHHCTMLAGGRCCLWCSVQLPFFFFAPHQCSRCAVSSVHNFHDNWLSEKSVSSNLNLFQKVSHRCYRSLALCGHTVCSSSTFCLTLCYFYICSLHIVRFTCVWKIALFKSFVLSTQWLVNQTIVFWGTKEFGQLT